jgi:ribosomal protein S18 acetylase RimI-like enzyme
VLIRPSVPEDAEAIAAIQVRSFQAAFSGIRPADALAALDPAPRIPLWRERDALVAVDEDDTIRGVVEVGPSEEERAGEIYRFFVDPECWRQGVGQALMRQALGQLEREDFAEALLWVHADNVRARRFYEAGGWWLDGAEKDQESFDRLVKLVCYRIAFPQAAR